MKLNSSRSVLKVSCLRSSRRSTLLRRTTMTRAWLGSVRISEDTEFRIAPAQVGSLPDPVDAEAIASILGGQEYYLYTYAASSGAAARKAVPHTLAQRLIPLVAATGHQRN